MRQNGDGLDADLAGVAVERTGVAPPTAATAKTPVASAPSVPPDAVDGEHVEGIVDREP